MKTTLKTAGPLLIAATLLLSFNAKAETEKNPAANLYKVTEAVVVRPLGFAATAAGSALYFITWPISRATGNQKDMYNTFVRQPSRIAFGAPQAKPTQELPQIAQTEVKMPTQTAKK